MKHKQEREKKKLANDLLRHNRPGEAAAQLGAKGGKTTAKRMTQKDPDYYKRIAAMVATRII
jgi:hypothetical protein